MANIAVGPVDVTQALKINQKSVWNGPYLDWRRSEISPAITVTSILSISNMRSTLILQLHNLSILAQYLQTSIYTIISSIELRLVILKLYGSEPKPKCPCDPPMCGVDVIHCAGSGSEGLKTCVSPSWK